jgi:hypothetical protein
MNFGFILIRHVNSDKTNKYWNNSVKLLRTFYPFIKIVIIDDNSNYDYVKAEHDYKNVEFIQSEFPKRGELLPYYYYLKRKFFENAVILHDSVFLHKRINFEKLKGTNVLPLWHFNADNENMDNSKRIIHNLKNRFELENNIANTNNHIIMKMPHSTNWSGCFGVQSYINLKFLERIQNKYNITNLIKTVNCRADRCCLERIFGCIFSTESPIPNKAPKSLFGDITKYQTWGYTYDTYLEDMQKKTIPKIVIKVWTGR